MHNNVLAFQREQREWRRGAGGKGFPGQAVFLSLTPHAAQWPNGEENVCQESNENQ